MKPAALFATALMLVLSSSLRGQVPRTISYQGVLRDAGGTLLEGPYDLTFRLWDVDTLGTTALWFELHAATNVSQGTFSVVLGSGTALSLPFDVPYWLEIAVGATTLVPRIELTAAPYSLAAESVVGTGNVFPSSGNVGIGTTSPSNILHVVGGQSGGQSPV